MILLGSVAFVERARPASAVGRAGHAARDQARRASACGGVSEPPPADDPDAVGRPEVNPMQIEGGADPGEPPERDRK